VEAWEYFMQGADFYRRYTKEDNARARELFEKAISLDPKFARAYALLAATHRADWIYAWTQDREISEAEAYRLAQHAVELARLEPEPKSSLPYALQQWAYVLLYRRQHQEASAAAEEAVQRNPNYADGFALWALVLIYRGEPTEALRKTQEAIRLNPNYPFLYDYHRGLAYYVWGFLTAGTDATASRQYYQQAETHLREALRRNQNFRSARTYLVAVLSELGRQEEAEAETARLREMGRLRASEDPARFQAYIQQTHPYEMAAGKRLAPEITTRLIDLWKAAEGSMR
jgi:adenylate cyclase